MGSQSPGRLHGNPALAPALRSSGEEFDGGQLSFQTHREGPQSQRQVSILQFRAMWSVQVQTDPKWHYVEVVDKLLNTRPGRLAHPVRLVDSHCSHWVSGTDHEFVFHCFNNPELWHILILNINGTSRTLICPLDPRSGPDAAQSFSVVMGRPLELLLESLFVSDKWPFFCCFTKKSSGRSSLATRLCNTQHNRAPYSCSSVTFSSTAHSFYYLV